LTASCHRSHYNGVVHYEIVICIYKKYSHCQ